MFLINGHKSNYLDVRDRAIQFGDGIFTTARIIDGRVCLYNIHLSHLQEACKKLFIKFTEWDALQNEIFDMAEKVNNGVLKVIISRGSGDRGYYIDGCLYPSRIISTSAYPDHLNKWKNSKIKLITSPVRLSRNPVLAGIKHLNRLEQVIISTYLKNSGADEVIVLDTKGIVTECCAANLFWRCGSKVFTPNLDQAGVKGVMREFCLSQLSKSSFHCVEVSSSFQELFNADEIVICNALITVLPVYQYEDVVFSSRKLYKYLANCVNGLRN